MEQNALNARTYSDMFARAHGILTANLFRETEHTNIFLKTTKSHS